MAAQSNSALMTIAASGDFQNRVAYALMSAAAAIMAEVNTTPSHAARVTYANKVISGAASILQASILVVTNAAIAVSGTGCTDNDIQFAVNSFFNDLAGVAT